MCYKGVFVFCEFSQDPERLPRTRLEIGYKDRVLRGNLVIGDIRECSLCGSSCRISQGSCGCDSCNDIAIVWFVGVILFAQR